MWEYLTCKAMLQDGGTYRAEIDGRPVIVDSLTAIFNELGRRDWEMVNCFPSGWHTTPADAPAYDAVGVTAVFKRQRRKQRQNWSLE